MISNEDLNKIVRDCEASGHKVTVRDISFVLLCRCYSDIDVAGKAIFGSSISDYKSYSDQKSISFLRTYINANYKSVGSKRGRNKKELSEEEITFEENKAEIIKLIKDTQKALEEGKIEPKDAYKIQADLRVKLNDKFSVKDETQEQIVVVNTKYNSVCECGRELYIPTKEDLMKQYNLIENK